MMFASATNAWALRFYPSLIAFSLIFLWIQFLLYRIGQREDVTRSDPNVQRSRSNPIDGARIGYALKKGSSTIPHDGWERLPCPHPSPSPGIFFAKG